MPAPTAPIAALLPSPPRRLGGTPIDNLQVEAALARFDLRDDQKMGVRAFFAGQQNCGKVRVVEMPTGSGKTRVGVAAADCIARAGYTVFWVCKRWKLLRQAAETLRECAPGSAHRLARLGGRGELDLPEFAAGVPGRVVFTTLQTWFQRRGRRPDAPASLGPTAVVWDEVHWGFDTDLGRAFRDSFPVPTLGLSATPPKSECAEVVFSKPLGDYFGTVLATPSFETVRTGVDWAPVLAEADFDRASIEVLARDRQRNTVVVDTSVRLRTGGRAKCAVVFAADIAHAAELARLLCERGVPARSVHSRQKPADQEEAERDFRAGRVDVLVNVDQLTEGFDHPPVDAVLLTRPTRSRRRWVQMVGRGARKSPGKDTFMVVDFADNVARFGEGVVTAGAVYPDLARAQTPRPSRPPAAHVAPPDAPKFENYAVPGFGTVPIALGQTFGVEIELTGLAGVPSHGPGWRHVAQEIIGLLKRRVVLPVHPEPLTNKGGPTTAWRVTYDVSCGWEVVSPVLVDAGGLDEVRCACEAVSSAVEGGLVRVDHRTGLHLTMATRLDTDERLRGFVRLVQRLEAGLFTLVAPSRLYAFDPVRKRYSRKPGNRYCLPLRALGDPGRLEVAGPGGTWGHRYRTVNLTKVAGEVPLIEVRMHHGTHDPGKIALWTSLWMQLFNAPRYRWDGPAETGHVFPRRGSRVSAAQVAREDIVALLEAEGVPLTPEFAGLLRERRRQLRVHWRRAMPHRVAAWESAGWYGGSFTPAPVR